MSTQNRRSGHSHTVRPRWTWLALIVMVAGVALVGVGISAASWAWTVPGLVLLVLGGVAGVYGGFFYDVQGGSSLGVQMREVTQGTEYDFPGAGRTRQEDEVKRDVRRRRLSPRDRG